MKLTGRRAQAFVDRPDADRRVILLYGPDVGLVSERAGAIVAALVPDPSDPFAVAELTGQAVAADPARLVDETRAMSLGGGNRVVRLRAATDGATAAIAALLDDPPAQSWVVMEAGELSPRSTLRQACEKDDGAAAIACYGDESRDLDSVIEQGLRGLGLRVEAEALAYLTSHLGADRLMTRGEIEKLGLYMVDGGGMVRLADAIACVGDSAPAALDRLSDAVGLGDGRALEAALPRVMEEGISPIAILRTLIQHFRRLHLAAALVAGGTPAEQAIKSLRPPVIFKQVDSFRRQLQRWPEDRLTRALGLLLEAEIACKSTGMPAETVCARALMRIAFAAGR